EVDHAGRHHRQGHADRRVERRDRQPQGREGDPRRLQDRRRRHQGPDLQADGGAAVSDTATTNGTATLPRLKQRYNDTVRDQLKDDLQLDNIMQVPRFEKIVINMGVGKATQQPSLLEGAVADLTLIAGQKPVVTKAKKSIASFKLREGNSIGCKVTLRGD